MQGLTTLDQFPHSLKLEHVPLLLIFIVGLITSKFTLNALYNIYFHPLRTIPGPKYAAATGFVYIYIGLRGDEVRWTHQLHQKYGEIVRTGPDRISYISPQAWKDIAGHRSGGRLENSKDPRFFTVDPNGEDNIVTVKDTNEHGRIRKVFTHAFSDKSLRLQEPLIRGYVAKLVALIKRTIATDSELHVNVVRLYNYTTFDIMGDLAFGEPLGMLDTSEYTPWVKTIFENIKFVSFARMTLEYPWIGRMLEALQPGLTKSRMEHFNHSAERVDRRLAKGIDIGKPDIWKMVLDRGKDLLTVPQMHTNSSVFMTAGTETTATLLSGLTFLLLKTPDKMEKLLKEVRSLSEEELSLEMLPRLRYLNACFEETLRLYPPVPIGLPRMVAKGGNSICGQWIPEGTRVAVSQHAAYHSALNFKDPESFVPERWLLDSGYESDRKEVLQPFSFGPRNCIGKNLAYHEMRIILATVLWNFDLELCPESYSWSEQKVHILWEKPELMVKIKPIR